MQNFNSLVFFSHALYILGRIFVHLLDLFVGRASNKNIEHIETPKISTLFVALDVSCQM
jgi:hypothetical protein